MWIQPLYESRCSLSEWYPQSAGVEERLPFISDNKWEQLINVLQPCCTTDSLDSDSLARGLWFGLWFCLNPRLESLNAVFFFHLIVDEVSKSAVENNVEKFLR